MMKIEARMIGKDVAIRPATGVLKGVNVFVVPDLLHHYDLREGSKDYKAYFKEWFQSVADNCVC